MTHISGKTGRVYGNALLVEDCEDVWTTGGAGNTPSVVAGKVGTYCARDSAVGVGAALLQYEGVSLNLTAYDGIYAWVRSSVTTAAGDLQILLDEHNTCASPIESLNLPALATTVWKQVFARLASPGSDGAILAVGLKATVDLADGTFDIDDVEALAEIDGIKSWTLDYTADTLETTDFYSGGVKDYIIGGSGWSGSFEGYKDGVPLGIGAEVYLTLGESATAYQNWLGKVFITGAHPNTSADGIVTYSYDFQGTGAVEMPSA